MKFTDYYLLVEAKKTDKKDDKWIQKAVKEDGSLKKLLGLGKDDKIVSVSNADIKKIIKEKGATAERKLIAYANMIGESNANEKARILKIVKAVNPKSKTE